MSTFLAEVRVDIIESGSRKVCDIIPHTYAIADPSPAGPLVGRQGDELHEGAPCGLPDPHLGSLSGRIMTRQGGGVTFGLPACLLYFPTVFRRICSKFWGKLNA